MILKFFNKFSITRIISNYIFKKIKIKRQAEVDSMPKLSIKKNNIQSGSILVNRQHLLEVLPKNGIVAELGVDSGYFTEQIIKISNPKKLYIIDTWSSKRYGHNKLELVKEKFSKEIKNNKIEILRSNSIDAAKLFQNKYFDWIYIDTDHSYLTTSQELNAYESKIKNNGFICGHDYVMGNWSKSNKYGVIESVNEFLIKKNWKFAYWTLDFTESNSFAIQRMDSIR